MEQSASWEGNRFAASHQEILRISWNPKVHYRTHKCPPPVPILIQIDPVHIPTSHFLKIHLNIIHPSMSGFPQWSLFPRIPHQRPVHSTPLRHTRYMNRPSHSSGFYHPHNIGWGVQSIKHRLLFDIHIYICMCVCVCYVKFLVIINVASRYCSNSSFLMFF